MRHERLDTMTGGWFVGDFLPSALRSTACEVAVKHYRAGEREALHHHRIATEVTGVISGSVRLCGRQWQAGDLVVIEPGEATGFEAVTDAVTVVVKLPAARHDKYPGTLVDTAAPLRIAVCLSGAERLDTHALTFFARSLPEDARVDCFCYMWEGGRLGDEAAIAELIARKTQGRFGSVEVAVGRDFAINLTMVVQKYPETNIEGVFRMFHAIRRCNDMKVRREIAGGFVYDGVVRTRSDLRLSSDLAFARYVPVMRDFIVFPENGHWRGGLNDQFAFSSSANMDSYSSVADHIAEHCGNGCVLHPETLLRFHLMKMGRAAILAPVSALVVRE